ncbi:MAG: PilZ domain-containing protein [Deltaproteobacteria bacterium]|nr:PilZ domain-containing protein [Deltaproteobacteria bacterium]
MIEKRRGFDRVATQLSVTYFDGDRFLSEFVHNASPGGVMIKGSVPAHVGSRLDMVIDIHEPWKTEGTIAWVEENDNTYSIGVQFKKMNPIVATIWADFIILAYEIESALP